MTKFVELSFLDNVDKVKKVLVNIDHFILGEGPDDEGHLISINTSESLLPEDVYFEEGYKEIKEMICLLLTKKDCHVINVNDLE